MITLKWESPAGESREVQYPEASTVEGRGQTREWIGVMVAELLRQGVTGVTVVQDGLEELADARARTLQVELAVQDVDAALAALARARNALNDARGKR